MKTLALNIRERLVALGIFNNPENKVATSDLKIYLEDVSKFRLTEEDKEAVKWEDIIGDDGKLVSFRFDDSSVDPKEIEVDGFTAKFLLEKLESFEYSAADQLAPAIVSLLDKLK